MTVATAAQTLSQTSDAPHRFDPARIRRDFPILGTHAHGRPLVYLDNGATTQKPQPVIDAITQYYNSQNANIHRGVYALSQLATELYEKSRLTVQKFINAQHAEEIIFTRGTTEAINLVAHSYARAFLKPGDEILVSAMEHHSNIVPWQMACQATGAILRVIPMNDAGELIIPEYIKLLASKRVKLVAVNHVSNSLGTINPVKEMSLLAHRAGALILIDGAQWVAHHTTDVRDIDADFYCFSGHKLFAPTGTGILYGKKELLDTMPPYQGGGDMIKSVSFEKTVYADLPNKFEAGTPNIAGAIGLAAAINYLQSIGFENFEAHERDLLEYATRRVAEIPGLRIVGTAKNKAAVISFVIEDPPVSSLDIGMALDKRGVAVRTGHHCCQPVMDRFAIAATTRISLAFYSTREDIDAAVSALKEVREESLKKTTASPITSTELRFPARAADSPQAAADQIAELFDELSDHDARNQYLLEIGEKLPPMPAALKIDATRVHGCMSTVHLYGQKHPGSTDVLDFVAESDAHVVRGLIGLLQQLFAGQRAPAILAFNIEQFFNRIGLEQFITVQRRNGLAGMVKKIRALAAQIAS